VFPSGRYFFLLLDFCASALPAADFPALPVRPSLSTFDAMLATLGEVLFLGASTCDKALPAAAFVFAPVLGDVKTFDAALAAFAWVVFDFPIIASAHSHFNTLRVLS
jgi:hypothetical protein